MNPRQVRLPAERVCAKVRGVYQLYGAPGRGSAAPEAVLEQMQLDYEYIHLEPMDARKNAAYRKLNPQGQIPTLVDGDIAVWESAAICLYLCDKHPDKKLAPAPGTAERGLLYQWLFFLSNTLQPAYMMYFYPDRYSSATKHDVRTELSRDAAGRVAELWQQIDAALARGPYFLGESFSVCDIYLFMLSTWHRESIIPFSELPRVRRLVEATSAQPGVIAMMRRNAGH